MIKRIVKILLVSLILTVAFTVSATADGHGKSVTSSVDLNLGGWARVDYGYGEDRFGAEAGDDSFGISRMALVSTASYEQFSFTAVLGATILSDDGDSSTDDTDIDFKDLFITWSDFANDGSMLRLGVQPIMFGLKPEGWPGDRSIVSSIEYGGGGAFAVSNQGGAAVVAHVPVNDDMRIELGAFDTSDSNAEFIAGTGLGDIDGSSLYKNYFAQIRADRIGIDGLYGVAGAEGRYVGGATDDTELIWDIGLGYQQDRFDISVEYISLDETITGTADEEAYLIAELTVKATDNISLLADYGHADELDVQTVRAGLRYDVNDHVWVHLEYAGDFYGDDSTEDVDSGHARLGFMF